MCVYSKFGNRQALLGALYDRAAADFLDSLKADTLLGFVSAYRQAALGSGGRYEFLFGSASSDPQFAKQRQRTINQVIQRIVDVLPEGVPATTGAGVWALLHGLTALNAASPTSSGQPDDADRWQEAVLALTGQR